MGLYNSPDKLHYNSYKVRITFAILLTLFALTAKSQPRFVADTEILKVGEILYQQPRSFTLSFTNKGNQPLIIKKVSPSCGCMEVTYPVDAIEPGKKGEMQVKLDANTLGTFYKDIEITTNASSQPVYMALQGYIVTELSHQDTDFPVDLGNIRLEKAYVEFDDVQHGEYPTADLRVLNMEHTAFQPQLMHLPQYLTASYEPLSIAPGKVGTIHIQLDSRLLPMMGLNQTSIYMARYLGDKVNSSNEIAVSAVLLPDFSKLSKEEMRDAPSMKISENLILMGNAAPQGTRHPNIYDLTITNEGASALQITQVQVFGKSLSVHLKNRTLKPGKSTRMRISLQPEMLSKDKSRPRVLIISNDPAHPKEIIEVKTK